MKIFWQLGIAMFSFTSLLAQSEIEIRFPNKENWNVVEEGETLEFELQAQGGLSGNYTFSAVSEAELGISMTEDGKFSWTPTHNLVDAAEGSKTFPVIFEVSNEGGQTTNRQVDFIVRQKTRLPAFTKLDPFYIKKGADNTYKINLNAGEYSLEADSAQWPEGMQFQPDGQITWKPADAQFLQLQTRLLEIPFYVRDLKFNDTIPGTLQVMPAPVSDAALATKKTPSIRLSLPTGEDWNVVEEGEVMSFKLAAKGGKDQRYKFTMPQGSVEGITFDTLGNFYWKPGFDFVDRLEESKSIPVIFEVSNASKQSIREQVNLIVLHTNRPPEVEELKPFYIQYGVTNTYQLNNGNYIKDPDNDPIVFKPILSEMPQGMMLNGKGELTWKPSLSQYYRIQKEAMMLEFIVEDQPYKGQTKGVLPIRVTQQDLPPDISMVPNQDKFRIKEDETLNLKFYLSDPNGDQDIKTFDFVADNSRIPKSALVKNDPTQWEFVWSPGYDFFVEPGDTGTYTITFFVIDHSSQRKEKQIQVFVEDAENLAEKDRLLYSQYRTGLVRVWNLMEQLREKEKELKKEYKKARKGKRQRAITTASLGAVTGISPIVLNDDVSSQRVVSGIGGTTSLTLGSLEASNVIGRDPSSVFERLSYISQKLNELESQGNVFAGKYALSNLRRSHEFGEDLKKLILALSLKDVTTLELDASWENPKKPTDKNIQAAFKDFNPDESKSTVINE